ncbi:MAG TPA: tyrosine-protein phosphatase [Thermoanaerobaculia bacterium]|nr:tyrosine-protein phosphatase [Thermoanaerobaculia bacterium]
MRYAGSLIALGLVLVSSLAVYGAWGLPVVWLGGDLIVIGCAYLKGKHRIFGKDCAGCVPRWSRIFFFPYLVLSSAIWHASRIFGREQAYNLVREDLVVGRRLLPREVPEDFANYVDLTAELEDPVAVRGLPGYVAFPILDASAPDPESLKAAVRSLRPGATFIHCAQGHGRTGLFAVALLLASGEVRTIAEGFALVQSARPGIHFSREQRRCLERFSALVGG